MKIEHVAIWVRDLEKMRSFYEVYFGAVSGELYHNPKKDFRSYFLRFVDGARLELMSSSHVRDNLNKSPEHVIGLAHLAVSVGSQAKVDEMVARFAAAGVAVVSPTRWTGDGYYEAVILDPEGNTIEVTI